MKLYLAGSIYLGLIPSPEKNLPWREWITPKLAALGIRVLNPLHKPEEAKSIPTMKRLKREGRLSALKDFCVKKVIDPDLEMIKESEGIIAVFERDSSGRILWSAGTVSEVFFTWHTLRKPALIVIPGMTQEDYIEQVGAFIVGMATMIFDSFEELLAHLESRTNWAKWTRK
ncbi:MAG: hypothetical protein ACFFGZ_01910 [Candidatus Thorarchaeota archaeon]